MKIHEYQGKAILREFGVPVPNGDVADTPAQARAIAQRLGGRVVVKAQVHAGGRGKAGGVKGVKSIDDIGRALGLGQFDTTRAVFQLMQSNLVSATMPRPVTPVAIVELFNQTMSLVLQKVDEVGGGRDVREQLASFATASGVYDALFREAGPRRDGTLDPQRIADNIEMLVGREDSPKMLTQWLYEYATFAMFIAEPLLRSRKAKDGQPLSHNAAFSKHIAELLKPLAPD